MRNMFNTAANVNTAIDRLNTSGAKIKNYFKIKSLRGLNKSN
jgi:hypothetical protein